MVIKTKLHKSIYDDIIVLGKKYPITTNNDVWLFLKYCAEIDESVIETEQEFIIPKKNILEFNLNKFKTIERIRRDVNADGNQYPTDPQIANKRGIAENLWKKFYAAVPDVINRWDHYIYGVK